MIFARYYSSTLYLISFLEHSSSCINILLLASRSRIYLKVTFSKTPTLITLFEITTCHPLLDTHTPSVPRLLSLDFFFFRQLLSSIVRLFTLFIYLAYHLSPFTGIPERHIALFCFFYACNPKHQKECLAPSRHSTHLRILKYTITLTAVLRIDYRKLRAEAERPTKKPSQFSTRSRRCHFQRDQQSRSENIKAKPTEFAKGPKLPKFGA